MKKLGNWSSAMRALLAVGIVIGFSGCAAEVGPGYVAGPYDYPYGYYDPYYVPAPDIYVFGAYPHYNHHFDRDFHHRGFESRHAVGPHFTPHAGGFHGGVSHGHGGGHGHR